MEIKMEIARRKQLKRFGGRGKWEMGSAADQSDHCQLADFSAALGH